MATGGNRVWSEQSRERKREKEREREQRINRVRDGALDRYRNGVSCKWPLVKNTPEYFKIPNQ